jgi:deoxyadenosine/deoxycytidine kinase
MIKQGFIIAVSGGPATGKSTLVKKLAEHYKAKAFLEGEEKDYPARIWKDVENGRNQLELIVYFRNKQVKEYQQALRIKNSGGRAILDTFYLTNEIYADQWIKDKFERAAAKDMIEVDSWFLPLPDLTICLSCDKKMSLDFLAKRGRKHEQKVKVIKNYLKINAAHDKFFKSLKLKNVLFIDRGGLDFEKEKDLRFLIKKIDKKINAD